MKLLLTAFDPFGGESANAAQEAVRLVSGNVGDVRVVKLTVPTVFGRSVAAVAAAIEAERPDAVLCVGQAGGRAGLTPERVPIVPGGPAAYFSTLPVKAMVRAIRDAGLLASVSNSAGTFVCNHLMYGVLHLLHERYPGVRGGFLHVPLSPAQAARLPAGAPSLPVEDMAAGIEAAIGAIAACERDITAAEGALN